MVINMASSSVIVLDEPVKMVDALKTYSISERGKPSIGFVKLSPPNSTILSSVEPGGIFSQLTSFGRFEVESIKFGRIKFACNGT